MFNLKEDNDKKYRYFENGKEIMLNKAELLKIFKDKEKEFLESESKKKLKLGIGGYGG